MGPSKRHAWVLIWMHVLLSGFSSVLPVNNVLPLESTLLNCLHSWISHGTAEQWFLNRFGKRKMTLRQQTLALTIDEKVAFKASRLGSPTQWIRLCINHGHVLFDFQHGWNTSHNLTMNDTRSKKVNRIERPLHFRNHFTGCLAHCYSRFTKGLDRRQS